MIDFTSSQLTWIVIGACSIGGTGYLSVDSSIKELDKKAEITKVKAENMEVKLSEITNQLSRLEQKIDNSRSK